MAGSQVDSRRKSTFYTDQPADSAAVRKLTDSGTIYNVFGNSQFFEQKLDTHSSEGVLEKEVSITGNTVIQAGASCFYSKPAVDDLAYTPPHILSRDTALPARKLAKTGTVKFPRLKEFVHFHYNKVTIGQIKVQIDMARQVDKGGTYGIIVECNGDSWVVQRNVDHMIVLDRQLHYCVFDRGYSKLTDLKCLPSVTTSEAERKIISNYLERFSALTGSCINCGTVLNFFELNSNGSRLISPNTESAINIPAVAAALVIKAYHACDIDELELREGDLVSVIDKPAPSESSWWRGKKELNVGFFPSECVEIIGCKKSANSPNEAQEINKLPVLRKRDKVIAFLRQFFMHRPGESQLKSMGIVKGRVFGTDLGEHLTNSALLVPKILTCCCDVIERHGLVDGIYRLSGRATQVQKLREDFDSNMHESFTDDDLLDIHTVSTLLKTYFRELPNPLLTYRLYEPLVSCVQLRQKGKQIKSLKLHISALPPPNYRTAKYLFAHLARLSVYSKRTSMTSRNLAIVWAPNVIRYDESSGSQNASGLLHSVSLQAAVTDLLISNFDSIFGESPGKDPLLSVLARKPNVKSLSKRLVSLSTARKRKVNLTRNYNSAADCNLPSETKSLEKEDAQAGATAGHSLTKSHSVSLDSVFTTSASVHLLENTASASSSGRSSMSHVHHTKQPDNPGTSCSYRSQARAITAVSSSLDAESVHSTTQGLDVVKVALHCTMSVPTPKPRHPKKTHDYVNFIADKPVPLMRSPPSIKKGAAGVKRPPIPSQKPTLRPYTVCSVPAVDVGHATAQRLVSAPQPQSHTVAEVTTSGGTNGNKALACTSRHLNHIYENVVAHPQWRRTSSDSTHYQNFRLHHENSDSDEYDNNVEELRVASAPL